MLKTRLITATVLIVVFLSALFGLSRPGWLLFAGLILAVAAWEWAGLAGLPVVARWVYAAVLAASSVWIAWPWTSVPTMSETTSYLISVAFWLMVAPFWLRHALRGGSKLLLLAIGWVVLAPCYFAMVYLHTLAPVTLLLYLAVVWIADSSAYFTGRRFGRRKLAPSISPGKTWEGVAGALLAVTAYGILWHYWLGWSVPPIIRAAPGGLFWMLCFLWILTVFSIGGDLFESTLKRRAGVKDSGTLLPGHGGVLDRIDALIPVLPLAALAFTR